jgi:transcriptional regulator PpsR
MNSPKERSAASRLSDLASEVASTVVRVAGDIAIVVGEDGVIRCVAEGPAPLHAAGQTWVGHSWADVVPAETRAKVTLLLQEAQQFGVSRRRELNLRAPEGGDIPVSWAAVRLGDHGPVLAVGRDLRAISAIQQRFLDSQQDLERDYWQRRHAESHYRKLFDVANDAVLVLDAEHFAIREANPAAAALFRQSEQQLSGLPLRPLIEPALQAALDELLITARATGRAAEVRLRLDGTATPIDVSATPFRSDGQLCLLLRARPALAASDDQQSAIDFIGHTPDAVVVTDVTGRVQWANPAFVALSEAPDERWLQGRSIAEVLGDEQRQWAALLARVRARGVVSQARLLLRVPGEAPVNADVAATLLAEGEQEQIGFTLRRFDEAPAVTAPTRAETAVAATATAAAAADANADPGRAAQLLAQDLSPLLLRMGHVGLPELLAQATEVAEAHLIQAALRKSGDSVEAAAALLNLPTAALLARMQHLRLGNLDAVVSAAPKGHTPWMN